MKTLWFVTPINVIGKRLAQDTHFNARVGKDTKLEFFAGPLSIHLTHEHDGRPITSLSAPIVHLALSVAWYNARDVNFSLAIRGCCL